MAKRKTHHPQHRITVADVTELALSPGVLVVRTGSLNSAPTVVALPAETLPSFLEQHQSAVRAAEEDYWSLISLFYADAKSEDNEELAQAKSKWLLAQPWHRTLQTTEQPDHPLFLVDFAGHVGLVAAPPFTLRRTLAIFDPLQLNQLAPFFHQSAAKAQQTLPRAVGDPPTRLTCALSDWSRRPWPSAPVPLPDREQSEETIIDLRKQFLRRSPVPKDY
ncbi:hypothetical protein [Streptomyces asiaticus]|uniref:hypothetical protein n=1 Tax=Streptomyces asiaticus TaxID=114695 RepID=UPI003F662C22